MVCAVVYSVSWDDSILFLDPSIGYVLQNMSTVAVSLNRKA